MTQPLIVDAHPHRHRRGLRRDASATARSPTCTRLFDEDVDGTAIDHLDRGLYEAHARDEAGFEDEGGHKQMWFAARDIAFENPVTEDETELDARSAWASARRPRRRAAAAVRLGCCPTTSTSRSRC